MLLVGAGILFTFVGGEFMPPLEEGNLWIRATLPQDISFDAAAKHCRPDPRVHCAVPRGDADASRRWAAPMTAPTSALSMTSKSRRCSKPPSEWRPRFLATRMR